MGEYKIEYRRNLPHIQPTGATFFITFRLNGSLSVSVIKELKEEAKILENQIITNVKDKIKRKRLIYDQRKLYFGKFDKLLDKGETGPTYLKDENIGSVVADAICCRSDFQPESPFKDQNQYSLICYSIMSNNVHMVINELTKPLYRIMQSLKTYTARESNKFFKQTGNILARGKL